MQETAISASPPTSAGGLPIRSIRSPTTRTSAYIPSTCAPMIGKTASPRVVVVVDDDGPGQRHHADHDAEARLRGEDRRDHAAPAQELPQRRGRARLGRGRPDREDLGDPLRVRAHEEHEDEADDHEARSRRARGARASRRRARRPERSGLKTAGPRIAPKTAPTRTSAMPRARRSGGYMSPAAARASSDVPLAVPTRTSPRKTGNGGLERAPERGQHAAEPRRCTKPVASTGHAAEPVHRAPGRQRREGARGEHDRRPEAEQPLDAGDEDERQRGDRRRELEHPRVGRERGRQERRVALDRELVGRHGHRLESVLRAVTRVTGGTGSAARARSLPPRAPDHLPALRRRLPRALRRRDARRAHPQRRRRPRRLGRARSPPRSPRTWCPFAAPPARLRDRGRAPGPAPRRAGRLRRLRARGGLLRARAEHLARSSARGRRWAPRTRSSPPSCSRRSPRWSPPDVLGRTRRHVRGGPDGRPHARADPRRRCSARSPGASRSSSSRSSRPCSRSRSQTLGAGERSRLEPGAPRSARS